MPDVLFVDPSAATDPVILVGGRCYSMAGDSSNAPDTFSGDIEATYSTCDACDGRAPCTCPDGLASSYVVHITAGTFEGYVGGPPISFRYPTQDVTIAGDPSTCFWGSEPGSVTAEISFDGGVTWASYDALFANGGLNSCQWQMGIADNNGLSEGVGGLKTIGDTPQGSYTNGFDVP